MQPFFAYLVLLLPSSLLHSCSLLVGDSSSASSSLLSLAWLVGWSDWLARLVSGFLAPAPAYLLVSFAPSPFLYLSSITRSSSFSSSSFSFFFLPLLRLLCTRFTPTLEPYQHAVLARQGALSRSWLIGIAAFLLAHGAAYERRFRQYLKNFTTFNLLNLHLHPRSRIFLRYFNDRVTFAPYTTPLFAPFPQVSF